MKPYQLLILVRRRRQRTLIAERHGLALGRLTGKRKAA